MRYIFNLLFILFLITGCTIDPRDLKDQYVKDMNGNIYEVVPALGVNYFLKPMNDKIKNLDKLRNKKGK